jgi:hypothetical protein
MARASWRGAHDARPEGTVCEYGPGEAGIVSIVRQRGRPAPPAACVAVQEREIDDPGVEPG